MASIISKEEMAALLGRSLSTLENANYDLYLEITLLRLKDLLCFDISELEELPADLKLLIARTFSLIVAEQSQMNDSGVRSKKVEDFTITYEDDKKSPASAYMDMNANLIAKYSKCQGEIRSGRVCCGDCIRCI